MDVVFRVNASVIELRFSSRNEKMIVKLAHEDQTNVVLPMSDHQLLRKVVSDVTKDISKIGKDLETIGELGDHETILEAECECCGLKEACTKDYMSRIRDSFSGKWVCGLCSEAVKERLNNAPREAIEEAVTTHTNFVQEFNTTTRLNPKLSFAWAMRDIAKKSSEKRKSLSGSDTKIMRSSSCVPRIDVNI